jgi:excinuclease ABC subunit C
MSKPTMSVQENIAEFDIKSYLQNLTERPGVYQMFDKKGVIIYVGKAKNLKKRVASYFKKQHNDIKTQAMVALIVSIETTVTDSESEAFILENTLIKRYKPKYNILFRDDKSYPYVFISSKPQPAIGYHRGAKRKVGRYFGPFPNAAAVHQTLDSLQKIFGLRQCAESVFNNRSRPCLQYQIKRCSAPCVDGLVSDEQYNEDVKNTINFLEGKSFEVIEELGNKMLQASEDLNFEQAAVYRDKISALRAVQSQHLISQPGKQDIDVIALVKDAQQVCISLMMYRGGNLWGSQNSFPKVWVDSSEAEILNAFISHHYLDLPLPAIILTDTLPTEASELEDWLKQQKSSKVAIKQPSNSKLKGLTALAKINALSGLKQRLTQKASQMDRVLALQEALSMPKPPLVMECFDVSHTQGKLTVASCVVFNEGVPNTQAYRKFNIEGIVGGDDYAAMAQVLTRRYSSLKDQKQSFPDLVIVDGGKGQLNQAVEVFKNLEIEHIPLVSVAKGEGRKAGLEILYLPHNMIGIDLESDDIALHLINHIRDEAHRFAITSHRSRRKKAQTHSSLEDIEGVGAKTRQKLLLHFGGLSEVKNAAVTELNKVPGISKVIAQRIYDFFHGKIQL